MEHAEACDRMEENELQATAIKNGEHIRPLRTDIRASESAYVDNEDIKALHTAPTGSLLFISLREGEILTLPGNHFIKREWGLLFTHFRVTHHLQAYSLGG
jgi:hypothetical protein